MPSTSTAQPALDLDAANRHLIDIQADATRVVQWASETFGEGLVMTSSFGAESAVMLHLVTRVVPRIPVIFVDTGYLFAETYRFAEELTRRLDLNLKVYQAERSPAWMEATRGRLWENGLEGLNAYDQLRKVEPMQRALKELKVTAWLAGLRRSQTDFRSGLRFVESQSGIYKIHPIIDWTTQDTHAYLKKHNLPYHPLYEQGYKSIGDTHSTVPITAGMSDRGGRFGGLKQECGIHLPQSKEEAASRDASGL